MKDLFGYDPMPWQVNVLLDTAPNIIVCGSRRVSKTTVAMMAALRVVIDFDRWIAGRGNPGYKINTASPALVAMVAPTRSMAKQLHFTPIVRMLQANPRYAKLVKNINHSDLKIDFHGNRPSMVFGGLAASEGDRFRGLKFVFLVVDEIQDVSYKAIDEALKPALTDVKGSQMLCIGSAKGKGRNALWLLYELSQKFPELYSFHRYSIYDNTAIPREAIENERLTKVPAVFAREYLGTFTNFEGMIYTEISSENIVDFPAKQDFYIHPKTGNGIYIVSADFGGRNCTALAMALVKDPNGGLRWCIVEAWYNQSGDTVSCTEHNEVILEMAAKYKAHRVICDPANLDRVLDIKTEHIKRYDKDIVMSGYNPIAQGVAQIHDLLYQKKLVIARELPLTTPNHVSTDDVYNEFCEYRYATFPDGTVNEKKIAEGIRDHILDSVRYALARANPNNMKKDLQPATSRISPKYDPELDNSFPNPLFSPAKALAKAYLNRIG